MRNVPLGPMWSAVTDPDLNALLHPASAFERPQDVVNDPDLTTEEKRAIFSSWASDACSVESQPAMRLAPGAKQRLMRSWMRFAALIGRSKPTPRR